MINQTTWMKTVRLAGATYGTCASISTKIWKTVIDINLTAVTLKSSGTFTSVFIEEILKTGTKFDSH